MALCLALVLSLPGATGVSAQAQSANDWTQPVNLSNSGSTSDPLVTVDENGITHVLWYDPFEESYRHSQAGADNVWSTPENIAVPFSGIQPRILSGPNDLVYAFWLDVGSLQYSRVDGASFGLGYAWEPAQELAAGVLAFDISTDADQTIHLAYLSQSGGENLEPGVFYRQKPANDGWTASQLVYSSLYFRAMQAEQAHVSVAAGFLSTETDGSDSTTPPEQIFVAWDEPSMLTAMLSSSTDGGSTWQSAAEIEPASTGLESFVPYTPDLAVWNQQALLVWKKQLSETTCEMQYRVSTDGQDWGGTAGVFSSSLACPQNSSFFSQREDLILWQAVIENQVVLAAWDGARWSEPQTQTGIGGIVDAASGKSLSVGERSLFYQADTNTLSVAGCDVDGNQDVWYTRKSLGDLAVWFLPFSSWKSSQELAQAPFGVENINVMVDLQGGFHALWTQIQTVDDEPVTSDMDQAIHYARWDGTRWTDPVPVVAPAEGSPLQMSGAASQAGELMAVWRGAIGCQIYFTRAPIDRAFSGVEWMEPVTLPTPSGTCDAPVLAAGAGETVYAAYAVVINEGRGIYLNASSNGGRTWGDPVKVFDAQAAEWEMADRPALVVDGSRLHMLWQRASPLELGVAYGLGYSYSDDGGQTWSVADTAIETQLRWADLAVMADGTLIRVWQQESPDQPIIVTQTSQNGGQEWSLPYLMANFGAILASPDLIADPDGGVHLIQISRDYLGKLSLRHWIWYGDNWAAGESLDLGYDANSGDLDLSGAISQQEQLGVAYSEENGQSLWAAISQAGAENEPVEQPQVTPAPTGEISTPSAAATIGVTETPTLTQPAEPTIAFTNIPNDRPNTTNTWIGLILGILLAAVVVVGVFWLRVRQNKA